MKALTAFALLALSAFGAQGTVINIKTAQEFIKFSNEVNNKRNANATVYLDNDIDFSGVSDQVRSIGESSDRSFTGVFDGQGHTLSHLTLRNTVHEHFGLFGISTGATVRNLILDKTCTVIGTSVTNKTCTWDPYTLNVGGLFGYCLSDKKECLLENNIFMGKISFVGNTPDTTNVHLGGIVASAYATGYLSTVKNCANYGSISFTGRADTVTIGGVAGTVGSKYEKYGSRAYNSVNYGSISHAGTTTTYLTIGGVVGSTSNCYDVIDSLVNYGTISYNSANSDDVRKDRVGAVVGILSNAFATHSFWLGDAYTKGAGSTEGTGALSESTYFDDVNFKLGKSVYAGPYLGSSLIKALDSTAEYRAERRYAKWLLNKSGREVRFAVNGEKPFFVTSSQLIMMPTLADGVEKRFVGWFTDSACTAEVSNFEIDADTVLYAKFA